MERKKQRSLENQPRPWARFRVTGTGGRVLTSGRAENAERALGHKSDPGPAATPQPTSCVTLGNLVSCSGPPFPSK